MRITDFFASFLKHLRTGFLTNHFLDYFVLRLERLEFIHLFSGLFLSLSLFFVGFFVHRVPPFDSDTHIET